MGTALSVIRSEIIKNVATSFQPDIFVVDHMPHGALGELASPLEALKRHSPHTKVVLGIRDILGAPDVIHRQWQTEGAFEAVDAFYDAVYIYGCADVFDVTSEYQFPRSLAAKAKFCGYVCRTENGSSSSHQVLPSNFSDPDKKFVLVTGGGGADASYFMDQFIEAVRVLHRSLPFYSFVSTGPFMHREQRALLRKRARGLPIVVSRMGHDSIHYLKRADLIISMAGYNTVSEIMRFKKNALIVPRPGPSAEQTMRCRIMSQRKLFSYVHPNNLSIQKFSELIAQKLSNGNGMNHSMLPDLNGALRMASHLMASIA